MIYLTKLNLLTRVCINSFVTIMALIYYLRSAWTNPGYVIGSAIDIAKRSGAYDPKMYAIDAEPNNVTVDISAAG